MTDFKDRMQDYVPVNERIEAFYAAWPTGTLQSEIVELTPERVTVKAYAYRSEEDTRPGIGHSSLEIPGSTSFTRGSEIENAETSAWGRAIAALGFEVKRGIASREEVRDKQPERSERAEGALRVQGQPARTSAPAQRTAEEQALLDQILAVPGMSKARMTLMADGVGVPKTRRATADELRAMIARFIESPDSGVPSVDPVSGGDGTPAADIEADDHAGEAAIQQPATGEVSPGASSPAASSTPQPDTPVSDAATVPSEGDPPLSAAPAPNDLMDDILNITGGELVPPKPGSKEYRALPSGVERAAAKAYYEKHPEPEPETLAEQMGAKLA